MYVSPRHRPRRPRWAIGFGDERGQIFLEFSVDILPQMCLRRKPFVEFPTSRH